MILENAVKSRNKPQFYLEKLIDIKKVVEYNNQVL